MELRNMPREHQVYKDYYIWFDPPPIPSRDMDWHFLHKDFDGPEDVRCGHGSNIADCQLQIDENLESELSEPLARAKETTAEYIDNTDYCIFSSSQGFQLARLIGPVLQGPGWCNILPDGEKQLVTVHEKNIVTIHPNHTILKMRMEKAKDVEKQMRPYWQAAIEHSMRLEMMMKDAVYAIARGV